MADMRTNNTGSQLSLGCKLAERWVSLVVAVVCLRNLGVANGERHKARQRQLILVVLVKLTWLCDGSEVLVLRHLRHAAALKQGLFPRNFLDPPRDRVI